MLPTSLLALTASFIAPILAAPSCTPSSNGYAAQKMVYLFNDFCGKLVASNFASKKQFYDTPVVALGFTVASVGDCSLKECLTTFGSLVDTCDKADKSIFGTGNVASSCGTYSFEIQDVTATNSLGAPDATITAATMKTYDIATLTSTSSSPSSTASSTASSTESSTASSTESSTESSTASSTSSTSSTSPSSDIASTTSEAQLESTYAPSTHVYLNATTSSEVASNSSVDYSSATLTPLSSATLVSASKTPTKPNVGTETLGTSGANVLRVSGLILVGVAGVFGVFL